MNYFIYILYSETFDKYYIGQTNSIEHRLERHNEFEETNSFTSKYRPWTLMAVVDVGAKRSDAVKIERRLKALKSKKIIANFAKRPSLLTEFAQNILSTPP